MEIEKNELDIAELQLKVVHHDAMSRVPAVGS